MLAGGVLAREGQLVFAVDEHNRIVIAQDLPGRPLAWESAMLGGAHPGRKAALLKLAWSLKPGAEILAGELADAVAAVALERERRAQADQAARAADDQRRQAEHDRREALRASLTGAKFRKATVALHMREGIAPESVEAWVYQGLAVHRRAGCGTDWSLTQVSSGLGLGGKFTTLANARLAAVRLATLVDWTTGQPASLTRNLPVRDMVSRVRHGDPLA
jgi:hypothetical protein